MCGGIQAPKSGGRAEHTCFLLRPGLFYPFSEPLLNYLPSLRYTGVKKIGLRITVCKVTSSTILGFLNNDSLTLP